MNTGINQDKRESFMKNAEGRVNKVINYVDLLKDMAKSSYYDYSKEDVENMFSAMQESLDKAKEEYLRKFELIDSKEKRAFSFGNTSTIKQEDNIDNIDTDIIDIEE